MRYGLLDMLGLAPFDPQKNTPAQLPGGMEATEYTATEQLEDGSWLVYPQIWWGEDGQPRWLGSQALDMALTHEANTGSRLPRFATREEADAYANKRSSAGGGKRGGIADIK
jgi:hypothetical protein|tara:strand:- start:1080 stop:1415 length:336 start_codon:yes stop_codon:yes gene_type:complete